MFFFGSGFMLESIINKGLILTLIKTLVIVTRLGEALPIIFPVTS